MKTKVFCIGFHKTGTTSISSALRILGYKVAGPFGIYDPNIGKNALDLATQIASNHDAFEDNPWPILYKEMAERFPESKFILTRRDPLVWYQSQLKHFGSMKTPMRKWIYGAGCPKGNASIYIERYKRHNDEVLEFFKDRQNKLLIMDLEAGDGFGKLCPFLGCEIPKKSFPHANKASERSSTSPLVFRCKHIALRLKGHIMNLWNDKHL